MTPDLASPSSVLCQQAAAVGLSQEGLLRHLVSAAAVRGGSPPLLPLPEVAVAEEERHAAAALDSEAEASCAGWGLLGRVAVLDEESIQGLIRDESVLGSWSAQAAGDAAAAEAAAGADAGEGAAAAGGFAFVDATGDASLDPVAQQQQAAWEEEQAAALDAPISYDEIAAGGEDLFDGAAGYADPGADSWAQQQEEEAGSGGAGAGSSSLMHPTKQRVWVLLGGDGSQRTQSLQAGLHAYLRCAPLTPPVLAAGAACHFLLPDSFATLPQRLTA